MNEIKKQMFMLGCNSKYELALNFLVEVTFQKKLRLKLRACKFSYFVLYLIINIYVY